MLERHHVSVLTVIVCVVLRELLPSLSPCSMAKELYGKA